MPQIFAQVNAALPSANTANAQAEARSSTYGELFSQPVGLGNYTLGLEGSYYKAINPTIGTGIAQTVQTSFANTNGVLTMHNGASAGGVNLVLDYVRLVNTVVGTSTTSTQAAIAIDNITRYSSGGSSITGLNNCNMGASQASQAVVHFGALTLASPSASVRYLSRFNLRTAIMVILEEWIITFGRVNLGGFNTMSGTAAQRMMVEAGPVVLAPGDEMVLHLWNVANVTTPPSWEFELAWYER
jgi:hypothetical protein